MALISDKMIGLLQMRIQHEEANSKAYTAMSNWLALNGFIGSAKLWKTYADDELIHKSWVVEFLSNLNILPIEPSQDQPQTEFKGLPQIVALSYQREINTTTEVKSLAEAALKEGDFMTFNLAQKYVAEQVEELDKIQTILDMLESFVTDKIALRLLDKRLGEM